MFVSASIVVLTVLAQTQAAAVPTFGTTVVIPSGLRGQIYNLHRNTHRLPNFAKMKPVGTVYTASLDVPERAFREGFPGVTRRYEWFAIDYTGRFWVQKPGEYEFSLTSDDGARLYIDDKEVIDNDGQHPPATEGGCVYLAGGIHRIRISYFQGPRFQVALILEVAGPGDDVMRVFSTDEFKPPPHPEDWKFSSAGELEKSQ